jgi:predicted transposase/invertase (TIGR01784 family)
MTIANPLPSDKIGATKGGTSMFVRYINPYTDFGFKRLFGEEANKDLLIDFLNAILPKETRVADLTFRPTEQLPDNLVDRKAIFDIACTGPNGELFTVEMQKAKQRWFKDRALFYASFPIQKQLQRGGWDFKLNPVFLVAVLDFEYDQEEERREIQRMVMLKDQHGAIFSDKLHMIFLQMPLFNKTESELVEQKDKWLYFLKHLESFDEIPSILRGPLFERAFDIAEYVSFSPLEQERYRESHKVYLDNVNVLRTAIEDGEARGEARGLVKGREEKAIEIARGMLRENMSVPLVVRLTNLSAEEIERLT